MEAEMRQKLQRVRRRRGSLVSHSAMAREDMPTIPLALALVTPAYALDAHAETPPSSETWLCRRASCVDALLMQGTVNVEAVQPERKPIRSCRDRRADRPTQAMAISKLAARGVLVHRVEAEALVAGL